MSFFLFSSELFGQQFSSSQNIDVAIEETSGLVMVDGRLITHNDSGNTAQLFEINTTTGGIDRIVSVTNATNVDWEDITADATHIYIGDIGNNNGNRTDLKVYKISIANYLASTSVTAEVINYSYADQTDFSSSPFATNFDAEALLAYSGQLYIFTKNWLNYQTKVYALPTNPGTYSLTQIDNLNPNALITGISRNTSNGNLLLCGYTTSEPIAFEISNFTGDNFSGGTAIRTVLSMPTGYSFQIEGVCYLSQNQYYVTSESGFSGDAGLFTLDMDDTLSIFNSEAIQLKISPNPVRDMVYIFYFQNVSVECYNQLGKLLFESEKSVIDLSHLASGMYFFRIKNAKGELVSTKKIMKD